MYTPSPELSARAKTLHTQIFALHSELFGHYSSQNHTVQDVESLTHRIYELLDEYHTAIHSILEQAQDTIYIDILPILEDPDFPEEPTDTDYVSDDQLKSFDIR